jgi:hypothetical protein
MKYADAKAALIPRLTLEFLATLIEAHRTIGWLCDAREVADFVRELHHAAGLQMPSFPELEPHEYEEDDGEPVAPTPWP